MAIDQNVDLMLKYGDVLLGRIMNSFCHQGTWFGIYKLTENCDADYVLQNVFPFIEFCIDWNERLQGSDPANSDEFDKYSNIIRSGQWTIETTDGKKYKITEAPVFFKDGEISWTMEEGIEKTFSGQEISN